MPTLRSDARRPAAVYALVAALLFQGGSGLVGGFALIRDPSGRAVGLPVHWLAGSPFADYLIPGILLFALLGVGPPVVAAGVWRRAKGSRAGALLIGAALLVWIVVQVLIVGYRTDPPLQAIYALLGIVILGLSLTPSVRLHLDARAAGPGLPSIDP